MKQSVVAEATLEDVRACCSSSAMSGRRLYCTVFLEPITKSMEDLQSWKSTVVLCSAGASCRQTPCFSVSSRASSLPILRAECAGGVCGAGPARHQYRQSLSRQLFRQIRPARILYRAREIRFQCVRGPGSKEDDKTSGSVTILGNSGQGKTYLLQLLPANAGGGKEGDLPGFRA